MIKQRAENKCRLSLRGCEFISVAFRSAKEFLENATFAEQKATINNRTMLNEDRRQEYSCRRSLIFDVFIFD